MPNTSAKRRRRPLIGLALLLTTVFPLTWLGAIGTASMVGGMLVLKNTSTAAYRLNVAHASTAAAIYTGVKFPQPSPIEFEWYGGDVITEGRTYWLNAPNERRVEITHAIAAPTLMLTATALALAALRSFGFLRRRRPCRTCPECGYAVVGLPSGICPECGKLISTF